jgi:glycosyltransferase involved in cell wall biosynthesis
MKASAARVLMLVENEFPRDTRVRNEAFTLASNGFAVSVVALRAQGEKAWESVDGVTVYRLPRLTLFKKLPNTKRSLIVTLAQKVLVVVGYAGEYIYFTGGCLILSCYVALREGFDIIHAHNPPDTLFIVGALFRLFGKTFVFDHHDLSPELYQSRYSAPNGLVYWALALCENASVKVANVVIATNESYRQIDVMRNGAEPSRVFVVRNGPDLARIRLAEPDPVLRSKGRVVLGYVGTMNPQDGLDYMLRALSHLRNRLNRKDFYCIAIGDGDSLEESRCLAVELGLADCVEFTGFMPYGDMIRLLSTADICLDPNPSSPLNDVSTCIKVMEYMALGKPLVSFDLRETRVSAGEAALYVRPNQEAEFAEAVARLMDDPAARTRMAAVGRARIQNELGWQVTSQNLLAAYEYLLRPVTASGSSTPAT